jgi:hypothetical protein
MPTRKQRRRELKAKRHDYETVWIDAEGNELDEVPPELLEREEKKKEKATPAKQQARPQGRGARREPQPPSWNRAIKRSGLLVIFFVVILSLGARGNLVYALPQAIGFGLLYIPLMYLMDRWIYRRYQARQAAASSNGSTPRPAKKR